MDIITISIAVLPIIWGIYWGIKTYKKQMNAQLFLEFTKRFEDVMQSFPKHAWSSRLRLEGKSPPKSKALSLSVLRYLNLCSEEYYLCQDGYLDKNIWRIWEKELIRTLQTPLFMREWEFLSGEFESYPDFKKYVDDKQKISRNIE